MAGKFINELSSNPPAPEDLVVFFDKSKAVTVQAPLSDVVGAGLNIATAAKGQTAVVDTKVDPISLETIPFLKWEKAGIDFGSTTTKPSAGTDEIITHDPVTGTNGKTTLAELIKSVLPPVTGADAGKQLTVDINGVAGWTADSSDLPAFTVADANKQLAVKADGSAVEWVADAKELPTIADGGKLLATKADKSGVEWIAKELPDITAGENILQTKADKSGVEWIAGPHFSTIPADGRFYTVCFRKSSPGAAPEAGWWLPVTDSALDFYPARLKSMEPLSGPTPSFSRASTGTYFDGSGALRTAAVNEARFNHVYNGTSWVCKGLLIEEQRTNILLNSASLSTQSVTTSATAYTLSFYGSGTVTLSGTSTAGPLVGTSVNDRVSLTFTPTAGALTLTVSGTVSNAQLEAGPFATSWISTTGSSATRSADVCQVAGSDLLTLWNASEGSIVLEYDNNTINFGTKVTRAFSAWNAGRTQGFFVDNRTGSTSFEFPPTGGFAYSTPVLLNKLAFAYKANDFAVSRNGESARTHASGAVPSGIVQLNIGNNDAGSIFHNGHIARLRYYRRRLPNSELQDLSK